MPFFLSILLWRWRLVWSDKLSCNSLVARVLLCWPRLKCPLWDVDHVWPHAFGLNSWLKSGNQKICCRTSTFSDYITLRLRFGGKNKDLVHYILNTLQWQWKRVTSYSSFLLVSTRRKSCFNQKSAYNHLSCSFYSDKTMGEATEKRQIGLEVNGEHVCVITFVDV